MVEAIEGEKETWLKAFWNGTYMRILKDNLGTVMGGGEDNQVSDLRFECHRGF